MSRLDYAEGVVLQLCDDLGLPGLAFDESHRLSLTFDEMCVTFSYVEKPVDAVVIDADMGPVPPAGSSITSLLLELNLQTWLRGCMTVGLDAAAARAAGRNVIPVVSLDVPTLRQVLEAMLHVGFQVRAAIDRPQHVAAADAGGRATEPQLSDLGILRA